MIINTEFDINDEVWDTLTGKKVRIIGFSINRGHNCCNSLNESTIYYVDCHMCGTFRKPEELFPIPVNTEYVNDR